MSGLVNCVCVCVCVVCMCVYLCVCMCCVCVSIYIYLCVCVRVCVRDILWLILLFKKKTRCITLYRPKSDFSSGFDDKTVVGLISFQEICILSSSKCL